jgi:NADH-quinone oxidoreductase subunit H
MMLLGFSQGTVPGWFGGVRIAAQTLAAVFSALIALLCAGLHAGAFRWSAIAAAQGSFPLFWTALSQPFQLLAFLVFMVSGLCLLGISPMEGAYLAPDLGGGVASHLSGYKLVLFRFGRFYGFFLWSVITTVLFLGAWNLPAFLVSYLQDSHALVWIQALELATVLIKSLALMLVVIWVARVNPRARVDQVTDLCWRLLAPAALVALIGTALWSYFLGRGVFG